MEDHIKETLIKIIDAIKRADGEAIASGVASLDRHLELGRARLHPQLVHFLERRSYPKALQFSAEIRRSRWGRAPPAACPAMPLRSPRGTPAPCPCSGSPGRSS